jgi:hypothetical protein
VGLVCNLLIRPVAPKWFMSEAELAEEKRLAHERAIEGQVVATGEEVATRTPPVLVAAAWAAVGLPLAWGIYRTLVSVGSFFESLDTETRRR